MLLFEARPDESIKIIFALNFKSLFPTSITMSTLLGPFDDKLD